MHAYARPLVQLVAYGGEDGVVGAFHAEYEGHAKRRQPHAAMSGALCLPVPSTPCLLGCLMRRSAGGP